MPGSDRGSQTGNIAWEGYQEMSFANDTYSEDGVKFRGIVREIAEDMIVVICGQSQDGEKDTR